MTTTTRELLVALRTADEAINPRDRSAISMDTWNTRLKLATAHIRETLANADSRDEIGDALRLKVRLEEEHENGFHEGARVTSDRMQGDLAEILRTVGLGDHARTCSPHEVVQQELLPRLNELVIVSTYAERDANRYRWLRKTSEARIYVKCSDGWLHTVFGDRLDRHIDAERSKARGES